MTDRDINIVMVYSVGRRLIWRCNSITFKTEKHQNYKTLIGLIRFSKNKNTINSLVESNQAIYAAHKKEKLSYTLPVQF